MKYPLLLSKFNQNWNMLENCNKTPQCQITNSWFGHWQVLNCVHTDGQGHLKKAICIGAQPEGFSFQ
jgi:hypothetical protein